MQEEQEKYLRLSESGSMHSIFVFLYYDFEYRVYFLRCLTFFFSRKSVKSFFSQDNIKKWKYSILSEIPPAVFEEQYI